MDASQGDIILHLLTEDTTFEEPTNGVAGQEITFIVTQPITDTPFTAGFAAAYFLADSFEVSSPKKSSIKFIYDGTQWVQSAEAALNAE